MAAKDIEVESNQVQYNGAPMRAATPPTTDLTHDSESGRTVVTVVGGAERKSRQAVIAAAKERRAAVGGKASEPVEDEMGSGEESDKDIPAPVDPAAGEPGAEDAGAVDDAAGAEDAPAEGDAAADPDGGTSAPPDVETRHVLERAQADLDAARRELDAGHRTRRRVELDAFIEHPARWARTRLAEMLGVDPDAPQVKELIHDLSGELTWEVVPIHDLPADRQAQLNTERLGRTYRLEQHRRSADQTTREQDEIQSRARDYATRTYDAIRAKHPHLALATDLDGRDVAEVITSTLIRAIKGGVIARDASEPAAFQEAIRLADAFYKERATRLGARLATLGPAPAPTPPGAASAAAAKKPASQAAPPKAPPNKPRAISTAQAGAAPSRPGAPPAAPAKKVIDMTSSDPEQRRRDVIKKHHRSG